MSTKSLKAQFVAAIAMVLVAALALGGSTFAWFAVNNEVTATGMTVTAVSDAEFLAIVEGSKFDKSSSAIAVTSTAAGIKLKPVAPVGTISAENVETPAAWHYAYSDDVAASKGANQTLSYTAVSDDLIGNGNYLGKETFSIGLNEKAGIDTSTTALQLNSVTLAANTGISCVVVANDTVLGTYTADSTVAVSTGAAATTSGTLVTVYYFINGEDTNVYTNNIENLTGAVVLKFGLA